MHSFASLFPLKFQNFQAESKNKLYGEPEDHKRIHSQHLTLAYKYSFVFITFFLFSV